MKITTSNKIQDYISRQGRATGRELTDYLGISDRAVRKQLKQLSDRGLLHKIGRPPKVYYLIPPINTHNQHVVIDEHVQTIIEKQYVYVSPSGSLRTGWDGFMLWCQKTGQDPVKTATEYVKTIKKYDAFRHGTLIDGIAKLKRTFSEVFLDTLYYLDFYSIERFGKTRLGQLLLYAKQSQNRTLIRNLVEEVTPQIMEVIQKHMIDGLLFVPPTVKRDVQLMKELERGLRAPVRTLGVTKVKTDIIVPQKTLAKLEDRVENARSTIMVDDARSYKNILLIDDAVGSGATLNETARQIRIKDLCRGTLIGLAITGSFKGFDVISEV